jgi:NAD(P)H-dependent FMN reductase
MKVAIISSSVREGRNTHKVAKGIAARLEAMDISQDLVDLKSYKLPALSYTYKSHPDPSEHMEKLAGILDTANAMIFVSPEYNGSFTAPLKDMVDYFAKGPFAGKTIGVATVSSGGMGGIRAAMHMQLLILGCFGHPLPEMLLTGNVNSKFDDNEEISDPDYKAAVDKYLVQFVKVAGALDKIE